MKILTEVSIILDMDEVFFFILFFSLRDHFKRRWIHYQLKIPIHIRVVCQQHIWHIKYNCLLYQASVSIFKRWSAVEDYSMRLSFVHSNFSRGQECLFPNSIGNKIVPHLLCCVITAKNVIVISVLDQKSDLCSS